PVYWIRTAVTDDAGAGTVADQSFVHPTGNVVPGVICVVTPDSSPSQGFATWEYCTVTPAGNAPTDWKITENWEPLASPVRGSKSYSTGLVSNVPPVFVNDTV